MDQKTFWSTPFRMSQSQWQWTVPLAFVGAGLIASDTAIEKHVQPSSSTASRAVTFSNAGVAAMVGVGGGMYLWGHITHDEDRRETGILSGEAAIDAVAATEVFKFAFGRDRPLDGDKRGRFFQGGVSFPSEHASVSWAIASVIAHEYPGFLTQLLAYGAAGGISAARVAGQQHFPSDVIVGGALGWYFGRQVYRSRSRHSDSNFEHWGSFRKLESVKNPANMGSSSVPLDSWIYPAMERLVAMGYAPNAFLGVRPWARMECARLLHEAQEQIEQTGGDDREARDLYSALTKEFNEEGARLEGSSNLGLTLDSIYSRFTGISGQPLDDGLHFGQTIVNDYGRPYAEGFNNVTGFSGRAEAGPLFFYARGEYQHADASDGISAGTAQVIQSIDGLPAAPLVGSVPSVDRLRLVEGYFGMQLNDWQFTFGKQALWWGADSSGSMLFSTNAEPILMLQINRVKPFKLPSFLGVVGPIRLDYIVGRLSGYHWVFGQNTGFVGSWTETLSNQPFIVGQKLSFKPTENLEFGISATALFGGPGVPATTHALLKAMFSTGNGIPGSAGDAGDRRGGFDFAYRIPRLRDRLTLYADAFTDDQVNPWFAWNKAAVTAGLYLSKVPKVPHLDLRVEGLYSDPPGGNPTVQHGFFYNNSRFKSRYTNDGNLIGSWIGRQGQGAQVWTTYWFTPRSKLQLNFRHQKVSQQFIPSGGSLTDVGISADHCLRGTMCISAWVQRERWMFPAIQANESRNIAAGLQLALEPRKWLKASHSSGNSIP